MKVRTRVAPSPTGYVHIGTIYNAIFAHALAKTNDGEFILRIEDTDQKRSVEGATEELYEVLDKFGLTPDEGPLQGGSHEPYVQSERVSSGIYMDAAKKLIEKGYAYYCFHTQDELKKFREENAKAKVRKVFRSKYRDMDLSEAMKKVEEGEEFVIRLKVPEGEIIKIEDAILGELKWDSNEVDDQVIIKSDGFPTYHLAVVVDDHDMDITHVTRGYDWVPSTPKQILIYRYLGYELPVFAHNGLILDPTGGKLSKRKGNVSAKQFLVEGYLVEAMINFLILIGWSADIERKHGESEREFFTHEEFIKMYKLEDRKKSSGTFDRDKLLWFNQQYIMKKSASELADLFIEWLTTYEDRIESTMDIEKLINSIKSKDRNYLESILELEKTRVHTLSELPDSLKPFYSEVEYEDHKSIKQLKKLEKEQIIEIGKKFIDIMNKLDDNTSKWSHETWEKSIRVAADELDIKHGQFFMSLRYLLTGRKVSPPLFEVMQILGKDEITKRISNFK